MNSRLKIGGFSIIELLIALIIMGILVAVIVPRYASRSEEAREKAAMTDLVMIKDAQQNVEIDTGYFVTLNVLDDVKGTEDDSIGEKFARGWRFQIDPEDADLVDVKGDETTYNWHGPYITWQKDIDNNDIPEDPWGNEYLLFSGKGWIIYASSGTIADTGEDYFDRFTILSLGKDGLLNTEDDLKIQW